MKKTETRRQTHRRGGAGWRTFAVRDVDNNDVLDAGDTLVTSVLTGTNGVYSLSLAAGDCMIVRAISSAPSHFASRPPLSSPL